MTYLDYQATTPLAPAALDAMLPWLRNTHANPHSPHREGRRAKAAVEVARDQIAALLPPGGRVVFTGGATEALNWAIKGSTGPITTWATEHAAVLDTVAAAGRTGRLVSVLPVSSDGLAPLVTPAASRGPAASGLHAAMLVNNEIGTINPIEQLADMAHAAGALFLCDAVQGYGRVLIPTNVDLVAISAHKVHGPKGIGALWIRHGVQLGPLLNGGDQEGGRSGTLSPALCAGFGTAAALMAERAEEDRAHVERLWAVATHRLRLSPPSAEQTPLPLAGGAAKAPLPLAGGAGGGDVRERRPHRTSPPPTPPASGRGEEEARESWHLNGPATPRYHGNLNIRRAGLDVARLLSDCRDIAFSAGSACASGSGRPSHVLRAIGLSDAEARSSIRLGWGRYTTEDDLIDALDRLDAAARAQRV